ncbi:hypothetical protein [Melittangium boletus]|uniref:Prolyl 4-hydroxylase alpha subunit Fe(2+) 2OG dioxygenase domain-containing protein n=1 Tax=Melittangium boletus DSM 14713 TaxID=1294270 RepID=A0A250ICZ2_9BACT|nr:hypothetical protein [Melittangium boletus]ATB29088.1 hypothetical protein MEBOL_002537 [Melittangium boletus DSM 14713]
MPPRAPLFQLHDTALPGADFTRLWRRVRALGSERLRQTYQTTFWFDLGEPSNVVEEAILDLRPRVPVKGRLAGVEWWLSRMRTTDVQVDFHQDRDEKLALRGGPLVHPRFTSLLFMNRVRGGALAVTRAPPCEDNPSLAPDTDDFDLAAPRPNRFVCFRGDLTHGVLDAHNQIPDGKLPGTSRLRVTLVMNWWNQRPTDLPTFAEARVYRSLASRRHVGPAR